MTLEEQQGENLRKAIEDFEGYLNELRAGASDERKLFIYRQAVACDDLMNNCNCNDQRLNALVTQTFVKLQKRGINRLLYGAKPG